jgi:hypothetical protein
MSTKVNIASFKAIDASIRKLTSEVQQQVMATADTQSTRLERLVKVYAAVSPLLTTLATLPIIPATWRAALVLFNSTLEAVAAGMGDAADFKAGKDLKHTLPAEPQVTME